MNMQTVITTIASIPFAMAIVALLKRQWPSVTGWLTPCVILLCTTAAAILGQYSERVPPIVWIIAGPIVAAISALGLHEAAKGVASNVSTTTNTIQVVPPADPLIRDTQPTAQEGK
jgi:hypothetical protein